MLANAYAQLKTGKAEPIWISVAARTAGRVLIRTATQNASMSPEYEEPLVHSGKQEWEA